MDHGRFIVLFVIQRYQHQGKVEPVKIDVVYLILSNLVDDSSGFVEILLINKGVDETE